MLRVKILSLKRSGGFRGKINIKRVPLMKKIKKPLPFLVHVHIYIYTFTLSLSVFKHSL